MQVLPAVPGAAAGSSDHRPALRRVAVGDHHLGQPGIYRKKSVVVVEIENRCMAGVVVWARGAYAGIKFDQPLKEDDPLISAGSM